MRGIRKSVKKALETPKRMAAVVVISIATWMFFTLLTRPTYSWQMITGGVSSLTTVLPTLIWNQNATYGSIGYILPALIGVLVGFTTVVTGSSLLQNYNSSGSLTGTLGSLIGFAGAGCASCGAGLLTLLGLSGGVALLPFDGLGIQILSIAILLGSLEYTGRQSDTCSIDPGKSKGRELLSGLNPLSD